MISPLTGDNSSRTSPSLDERAESDLHCLKHSSRMKSFIDVGDVNPAKALKAWWANSLQPGDRADLMKFIVACKDYMCDKNARDTEAVAHKRLKEYREGLSKQLENKDAIKRLEALKELTKGGSTLYLQDPEKERQWIELIHDHLVEQLRFHEKRLSKEESRRIEHPRAVQVGHFRNRLRLYLEDQSPNLLKFDSSELAQPTETDFVTFISHKWDGNKPFTLEDSKALLHHLASYCPREFVWLDFLIPGFKSPLTLGDYPRWILSCTAKIVVVNEHDQFFGSPWCVSELLMPRPERVIDADYKAGPDVEDRKRAWKESKSTAVTKLDRALRDKFAENISFDFTKSKPEIRQAEASEFHQCLLLAVAAIIKVDDPEDKERYAVKLKVATDLLKSIMSMI